MKASNEKKHERRFLDVKAALPSRLPRWLEWLKSGGRIVNLKPAFYKRYPFLVFAIVALIAISFFTVRNISTRAEVADFYSSTCLGTWQNPSNAQGEPENMVSVGTPAVFDDSNSAVLAPSITDLPAEQAGHIYCGSFVSPDYESEGEITSVGLTLVWHMDFNTTESQQPSAITPTAPTSTPEIPPTPTSTPSETEPSAQTSPEVGSGPSPASSSEEPGEVAPAEPSTTTQSLLFRNFRGAFINLAFAEESGAPAPSEVAVLPPAEAPASDNTLPPQQDATPPEITAPSAVPVPPVPSNVEGSSVDGNNTEQPVSQETTSTTEASETVILGPPLEAELGPVTSSTETAGEASTTAEEASGTPEAVAPPVPQPPAPDENFLSISYSVDGQTWAELAKVNKDNWKNLTFSLPIKSWDELGKVQIRIESILTTAEIPRVYLDGMLVEVHYEVTAPLELQFLHSDTGESSTPAVSGGSFLKDAPNPFPGMPQVVLPESGGLETQKKDWRGGETPTVNIDIGGLPAASSSASSTP